MTSNISYSLQQFITVEKILGCLATKRIKRAKLHKKIRKILQYNSNSELKQILKNNENDKLLYGMLPSRNKWKRPPKSEREKIIEKTANYNRTYLLSYLLNSYRKGDLFNNNTRLFDFIQEVKSVISSEQYKPAKAITHLLPDKSGRKSCRIVKEYELKDAVVAALVNKYLGMMFSRSKIFSNLCAARHSIKDAFNLLIKYKNQRIENCLYVCRKDIFSFTDFINQDDAINSYDRVIYRASLNGINIDPICRSIIIAFLKNINSYEDIQNYSHLIPRLNTINSFIVENYSDSKPSIGIPHGLPFTSLLANIFLEDIDREILYKYPNICYVRYVDDVLFIHPNKTICADAVMYFEKRIKEKKLLLHPSSPLISSDAQDGYYLHKSTEVFTWSGSFANETGSKYIYYLGYKLPFDKRSGITLQAIQELKDLF